MCTLQVRGVAIWIILVVFLCRYLPSMCCAGNHGDDNKTNNTTIPEWYFGSVALWHKDRAEWTGQSKGAVNADCPETRCNPHTRLHLRMQALCNHSYLEGPIIMLRIPLKIQHQANSADSPQFTFMVVSKQDLIRWSVSESMKLEYIYIYSYNDCAARASLHSNVQINNIGFCMASIK